jgi:hypothetical protein
MCLMESLLSLNLALKRSEDTVRGLTVEWFSERAQGPPLPSPTTPKGRLAFEKFNSATSLVPLAFSRVNTNGFQARSLCTKDIDRLQSIMCAQADHIIKPLSRRSVWGSRGAE